MLIACRPNQSYQIIGYYSFADLFTAVCILRWCSANIIERIIHKTIKMNKIRHKILLRFLGSIVSTCTGPPCCSSRYSFFPFQDSFSVLFSHVGFQLHKGFCVCGFQPLSVHYVGCIQFVFSRNLITLRLNNFFAVFCSTLCCGQGTCSLLQQRRWSEDIEMSPSKTSVQGVKSIDQHANQAREPHKRAQKRDSHEHLPTYSTQCISYTMKSSSSKKSKPSTVNPVRSESTGAWVTQRAQSENFCHRQWAQQRSFLLHEKLNRLDIRAVQFENLWKKWVCKCLLFLQSHARTGWKCWRKRSAECFFE